MLYSHGPRAAVAAAFLVPFCLTPAMPAQAETFSIVVLPDTQFYSQDNPGIFDAQTNWIDTNAAAENIIYVAHLGDIVDSQGCNAGPVEWGNADNSMATLDSAAIPYGVLPGNHDFDTTTPGGPFCATTRVNYNNDFGPSRYGTFWGGSQDGTTNDNNYTLFSSPGGVEFVAINLAYSGATGPAETATLAWAEGILQANPNRIGIVTSHSILSDERTGGVDCQRTDPFTEYGSLIWNELGDNPNLAFVLSGHCRGERWITFDGGSADRPGCLGDVHALMSNYQAYNGNQSGYLRIMRFDTTARTIDVETFSPTLPGGGVATTIVSPAAMDNNSVSNFSLNYNAFVAQCADVALAMDRSGSMNAPSAAISGSKLDALKNAADLFIDQIALDGRHRLVMEQFNSAPVAWTVPEVPWAPLDSGNAPTAHTMIGSIAGGGATNIIDGLDAGVTELDVVGPNDRRVVVLFTDGKHNTPSVLSDPALQTALESEINSVDSDMELYSVGFGTSISDAALIGASGNNGGWHVNEVDPIVLAKSFSLVAARVMDNQTLSDPVFVIKLGETRSHRFGVSRWDDNLTIAVHWDQFNPRRVQTRLIPPGGEACSISSGDVVPGVQQTSGRNYRLIRVNLPYGCNGADAREGLWEVQMTVAGEEGATERVNVVAYAASRLALAARVQPAGAQFDISALLQGGELKSANFTAFITPPIPDSGDSTRLDDLGSSPDGAASLPPLPLMPREPIVVPLTVTGSTTDSISAQGSFSPTEKGLYQVRVVANIVDATGQNVTREAIASLFSPTAAKPPWPPWLGVLVIALVLLVIFVVFRRRKATLGG